MSRKELIVFILFCLFLAGGVFGTSVWAALLIICVVFTAIEMSKGDEVSSVKTSIADVFVLVVILAEILSLLFSQYQSNSVRFSYPIVLVAFFWFFFRRQGLGYSSQLFIDIGLSGFSAILSAITIAGFISFKKEYAIFAPASLIEFKNHFTPAGMPINDWVAYLLCLLPYPFDWAVKENRKWKMVVAIVDAALSLTAIGLCLSRGAYVAVAIFILVSVALSLFMDKTSTRKTVVILSVSMLLSVVCLLPVRAEVMTTLAMSKTSTQVRSTNSRLRQMEDAVSMWKEQPWTGVGSGNFNLIYDNAINDEEISTVRVTNTYSLILVEKGLVGMIAYGELILAILVISLIRCCAGRKIPFISAGFSAMCVRGLFFSSLFYYRIVLTLVILLALWSVQETETEDHE